MGVLTRFVLLHMVQLNISGVRISFFRVTVLAGSTLIPNDIECTSLCSFCCSRFVLSCVCLNVKSLSNHIGMVGCSNRLVWFSYSCFEEPS